MPSLAEIQSIYLRAVVLGCQDLDDEQEQA